MSDAYTLIKSEDEKIKDFNKRILKACKDLYVTDGQIDLVDGQPVVTLMCINEDDVDDDSTDPISVMVARVSAVSDDAAEKSERFLGKLYEIAEENIVDVQFAVGPTYEWVTATDLITASKPQYAYAEMVRTHHDWGMELQEGFDAAQYKPIKSQEDALKRTDTGLIKYQTSYAIVAYLVPGDEVAETKKADTNNDQVDDDDAGDGAEGDPDQVEAAATLDYT